MLYEDLPRGQAKIASYLPTLPAIQYLNCCSMVGWHQCNTLYHQRYPSGFSNLLMIYTVRGSGRMETDGQTYTLIPNSIVLVPPHTPMEYGTDPQEGTWEFYWVNLFGDRALTTAAKLKQDGHSLIAGLPPIQNLFKSLLEESALEMRRSVLVGQIFDEIIAKAIFNVNPKKLIVDQILQYISEHYQEHIDLDGICEQFYFSKNQIIRLIRARTGYTPHEYLTRFRRTKACELLRGSQLTIREIGQRVGDLNNSHFSAAFRKFFGTSPAEYREQFSN